MNSPEPTVADAIEAIQSVRVEVVEAIQGLRVDVFEAIQGLRIDLTNLRADVATFRLDTITRFGMLFDELAAFRAEYNSHVHTDGEAQ